MLWQVIAGNKQNEVPTAELRRTTGWEPKQVPEAPQERRVYFDEEAAPGLRDLAQHWEEHLAIEEDYDGPC